MTAKQQRGKSTKRHAPDHGVKAAFIRQHAELSAKALVEAAAKQGLAIHLPQVYKVRAATTARAAGGKPEGEFPSKSAFIRGQPASMTAKQVVRAAAERGMVISETFVYNIRAAAKKRGGAARPAGPGRPGDPSSDFRKLVLDLGVRQARALLDEVEVKLQALVAGR
jgi:hypothetical protein